MKIIGIAILGAIGLFTGGCSLFFYADPASRLVSLQGPGFLIAFLCGWGVIALINSMKDGS